MSETKENLRLTIEIISQDDGWQLEVVNTITNKAMLCESLEKMNETIEMFYGLYPEHELQVMWLPSVDSNPDHVEEIRGLVDAIKADLDENKS